MTAHNFQDLTGQKFSRLLVLYQDNAQGRTKWVCMCDCKEKTSVTASNLKAGITKSCGCLRKETIGSLNLTHGMSRTPEFLVWVAMKQRCAYKKDKFFHLYGGRGISVCHRWINNFSTFISDMGPRPSNKHSIDRIDSNKNYNPSNCRWATPVEQARNRGINSRNKSGANGVNLLKSTKKWTANIGVNHKKIHLGQFDCFDDACKARKAAELKYW